MSVCLGGVATPAPAPFLLQCYYIGATDDAATKIINEVSKPLAHHIPVEKVCEKLKKKDSQICELKYGEYSGVLWGSVPRPGSAFQRGHAGAGVCG